MADTKRSQLVTAANRVDQNDFVAAISQFQVCMEISISDVISSMSKRRINELWSSLKVQCINAIFSLEDNEVENEKIELADQVLAMIGKIGLDTITQTQLYVPDSLHETAVILNGILNSLPEMMRASGQTIVELCETWYHKNIDGRDDLGVELITHLIRSSLQDEPSIVLLKRIWNLHEILLGIDLAEEKYSGLREMLLQCAIRKQYLKNEKGRKLITVLFALGDDMVTMLHRSIKHNLPSAPEALLNWYGEVYFKAWWASNGSLRMRIENDCIQDLMYHALYASRGRPHNMAKTLRTFLNYFHKKKRQPGVDDMLLRLYQPILWRSLMVANGSVRANAASLLLDAFPLKSEDSGVAEQDALVQKQIDILQDLLFDPCPLVRAICVHGICRLCSLYWELFPVDVLKSFIQKIVEHLAWDRISADVRLAVFQGLQILVQQPLSHPLLKVALPLLKEHLKDRSEKVRIGFINLLIQVKNVRTIKIWSVVSMEDLLERLAEDTPPVARRLVHLIGPSFLPESKPVQVQLRRCVALVDMNAMAARRFYEIIPRNTPVQTIGCLIAKICRNVLLLVDRETADLTVNQTMLVDTTPGAPGADNDVTSCNTMDDLDENTLSLEHTHVIIGLFEVAAIMWTVIRPALKLKSNVDLAKQLVSRYASALPVFFRTFSDARIISALYVIAGYIPVGHLNMFSKSCMSRLRSVTSHDDHSRIVQMMCQWNRVDDVLDLVTEWLSGALALKHEQTNQAPKRKSVSFAATGTPQPHQALIYLDAILDRTVSREHAMLNYENELRVLGDLVAKVKGCVNAYLDDGDSVDEKCTEEFMIHCLTVYLKLIALFAGKEEEPKLEQIRSLVQWLDDLSSRARKLAAPKKAFVDKTLMTSLSVINDMLLVGLYDVAMLQSLARLAASSTSTEPTASTVRVAMETMRCVAVATAQCDVGDVDVVSPLMTSLLVSMTGLVRNHPDAAEQLILDCKDALSETICLHYQSRDATANSEIMSTIVSLVLAETSKHISENGFEEAEKFGDLPLVTAHMLDIIGKKVVISRLFVDEFHQLCTVGGVLEGVCMLAAVYQLVCLVAKVNSKLIPVEACLSQVLACFLGTPRPDEETDSVMSLLYDEVCKKLRERIELQVNQ